MPTPILIVIFLCFVCYMKGTCSKIMAPKMRKKKRDDEPLAEFVSSDLMPMEDQDPELVMNPVMLAKIRMAKESGRKRKAASGLGQRSGGLARLGITIKDSKPEDKTKSVNKQMDAYLASQGVTALGDGAGPSYGNDSTKELEKKATQKKLQKAQSRKQVSLDQQEQTSAAREASRHKRGSTEFAKVSEVL